MRRRRILLILGGAAVAVLAVALFVVTRQDQPVPDAPWLVATDGHVDEVYECADDPAVKEHWEFLPDPPTGLTITMVTDATPEDLDRVVGCVRNAVKGTGVNVEILTNPTP
ncbi:hypothetical protein [Oerskovia enterophila]|uniref:hypothetical protein n=1 Tax=Oerskovia enterophila TaxID=43678 RepID=UPI00111287BC|nr:hypothetical protein [Oerskovia enterophila]